MSPLNSRASNLQYSSFQLFTLVLLRVAIGWHFLYEGIVKLFTPSWSAAEYLSMSRWIFADFFKWIVANPTLLKIVDILNVWGLIFIGLGLMLGILTRRASLSGMLLLLLYYVAIPPFVGLDYGVPVEGHYLIVNKILIEAIVLGLLAIFPTGKIFGIDRLLSWLKSRKIRPDSLQDEKQTIGETVPLPALDRREILKSLATIPFLGALAYAAVHKKSYEEKHLIDAVTGASIKTFDFSSLKDLKGQIPLSEIKGTKFSRLILGGNLLSGWAHSRDLIYVSSLVRAYHHKDKIFATLLLAEKCGINTLLTNPVLSKMINEYWDRGIGKIQFISDCVGLNYDAQGKPSAAPYEEFLDRIKKAIDHGACACYIQGETADFFMEQGKPDGIAKAMDLIRQNNVIAGIGAHRIETIKACVAAGFAPDLWMKTLHHHQYWSARHPEWHDNLYCFNPEETIAFMKTVPQPWIAFKTMAAGSIHPENAFRYAFENGADFICAGMYDFQMVDDVNIALAALNSELKRERPWMA